MVVALSPCLFPPAAVWNVCQRDYRVCKGCPMPTQPQHILLVEDDPIYGGFLTDLLSREWPFAADVQEVRSVEAALRFLREQPAWPDLILLDLRLPLHDDQPGYSMGLETLYAVTDVLPTDQVPPALVVMTGDITADEIAILRHGADEFVVKGGGQRWSDLQRRMRTAWARYQRRLAEGGIPGESN